MCSIDTVDDLGTVFHRHNLSGQLIKLEDWYRVHCHLDLQKCFIPSQTMFWRKEHNLLDQIVVPNLVDLVFYETVFCIKVYSMTLSLFTVLHDPITVHCTP